MQMHLILDKKQKQIELEDVKEIFKMKSSLTVVCASSNPPFVLCGISLSGLPE